MYRYILIIFPFIVLTPAHALSQTDSIRQEQYKQEQQYSKELQDKYNEIISYLSKNKNKTAKTYKKLLIESQKYWEKFIWNYCTLEAMPAEGISRGSDSFYRECKIEKAEQRLSELNKQYINFKEELGK